MYMFAIDEKSARLADEARAAFRLAARAVWQCLRHPRALLHLVRSLGHVLPRRRSLVDLSPAEVAKLRELLAQAGSPNA